MFKKRRALTPELSRKHAFHLSIAISLTINLILILGMLFSHKQGMLSQQDVHWFMYAKFFLWHLCCNIALIYLLFEFNFNIIRSHMRADRIPWSAALGTVLICFFVSPLLAQIQWFAIGGERGLAGSAFIVFNCVKDMVIGVVVILSTRTIYSNYKRERTLVDNQRLVGENIRMRFEALKNQLDPHFLFNSMNTLSGLIGTDDQKAHAYLDNLSSVFRYTLQNKHILTLGEELAFVEAYMALMKIRYGENLTVDYHIDEQSCSSLVLPVSLQLLVENAVKHNVISNRAPLQIDIRTTDRGSIVVSNRCNPKAEKSAGSGVGLANLADRYQILFGRAISIADKGGVFMVEVPLIDESEKKKITI